MKRAKSATSIYTIVKLGLAAAVFVGIITWGAVQDSLRVLVAAGVTFGTVLFGFLVLNALAKDENVKPGEPRLK
ncbi:MAG: hypothetical protein EBT65_04900 [Actinobacteria bacterium]|nr:hypothetical protein [Actinomycetota bacterium]